MSTDPRPPGFRLVTVGGVPVHLGWTWLLMAGLIVVLVGRGVAESRPDLGALAYAVAGLYALSLLVAVLAHEAAHAVAARAFGHTVHRVVADLWGGHTAFDAARATPGSSALIAVVGPLTNGALALGAWLLGRELEPGVPFALVSGFALINALLAAFNLLPGLPLDGGQVVEAAVWRVTGRRSTARVVAGWCGRVLVVLVVLVLLGRPLVEGSSPSTFTIVWGAVIGVFLWNAASSAITQGRALELFDAVDLRPAIEAAIPLREDAPLSSLTAATAVPVVVDAAGRPVGLLSAAAAESVPGEARPRTPVAAVTARQPEDWVVEVSPTSLTLDVVRALQDTRRPVLAVTQAGALLGVVRVERVNAAIAAVEHDRSGRR